MTRQRFFAPRSLPLAPALVTLALLTPATVLAQAGHVHQHGVGQFNLAVADHLLEIDIVVPGADILGFEHQAQTEAEQQAVKALIDTLTADPGPVQLPEAAKCQRVKASAHPAAEHGNNGQAQSRDHDHNHRHGHGHSHSGHDHGHGHQSHEAAHTEWHVHYHYECQEPAALNGLTLTWFEQFPDSQELQVQALTPTGQIGGSLTAAQPGLRW